MTTDVVRVVALVSGHVQGVGYRWFVRSAAEAAGLAGSAANLADGRVQVVLEGGARQVGEVVAALDGPAAPGHVERVDVEEQPAEGVQGFRTL